MKVWFEVKSVIQLKKETLSEPDETERTGAQTTEVLLLSIKGLICSLFSKACVHVFL